MSRTLVVVGIALAVLAGCAGSTTDPSGSRTTTAAPGPAAYTVEQLKGALPRSSQVPSASHKTTPCPEAPGCRPDSVSVNFDLDPPRNALSSQEPSGDRFLEDFAAVVATREKDQDAAVASVSRMRGRVAKYQGAFTIEAKSTSGKQYTPGEKGTGSVADLTIKGWKGFEVERRQRFSSLDGPYSDEEYQFVEINLAYGSSTLDVAVVVLSGSLGTGGPDELARQLAEDYVDRLR